jgi:hypothetical protein
MPDSERRRRRQRSGPIPGPPPQHAAGVRPDVEPAARTAPIHDPDAEPVSGAPTFGAAAGGGAGDDRETERGLRGLVGSGATQVRVGAALRARDASRPTDAEIAAAEQQLVIVRRGWVPRDELPRAGR